jgi:hypothetical protein
MKRTLSLAVVLLTTASIQQAEAMHRGAAPNGAAPILQAVSVPFGTKTPTGIGDVALNSPSITTAAMKPQTYPGLGLMSPAGHPCAFWTLTWVGNTSGRPSTDFTIIAPGTADASAVTPIPSSTGNQNLAGTYTWNASCTDGLGNVSNTVPLVYTPDVGNVTVGSTDNLGSTIYPGGFGGSVGQKITIAVGADRHTGGAQMSVGHFTNQVTITPADTARRPYLAQIGVSGSNPGNVLITDWVLSGAFTGVPTSAAVGVATTAANAVSDIIFDNIKFYGSETMVTALAVGLGGAVNWGFTNGGSCASNCVVQNSEFNYLESGVGPASNTAIRNVTLRYVFNNCIFMNSARNFEFSDVKCIAPMQRHFGAHPDMMQIADEAVPGPGILIQRFMAHQGDGDYFAQGPIFSNSNPISGYVDDGLAGHGPGNVFTKTSSAFSPNKNGVLIVIPGYVQSSAGVTLSCNLAASCAASTKVTLVGLAPTNIGSAASPVVLWGTQINNLQMSGIMSSQAGPYGMALGGNAGASYLYDFDYVPMDTQDPAIASFTGSIASGVLTATTPAVSNIPGQTAWIANPAVGNFGRLNYAGCNYGFSCGGITGTLSGASEGPGTYSVPGGINTALGTIQISGAFPGQYNPAFMPFNCSSQYVWGGTFNVDRGWFQSGYFPRYGCTIGVDFPASGMTIGAHAFGPTAPSFNPKYTPTGGDLTAADFASGMLPTAYLAAHHFTAADTPADILRINCLALKGKIGGKRDGGGGVWYGSVTGETNAVTHAGGGDWIIFNGTSHIPSTHIAGCELPP